MREGTQRQLLRSDVGLVDLEEVFLTHLHADHFLGLPGMLKTFALRGRELPLTVYGPAGTRGLLGDLRRIFGRLPYGLDVVELGPGDAQERDGYRLTPFAVDHRVSAVGYALVEHPRPGRFDVEVADRLGVPDGPQRGALQRGESVTLEGGAVVRPEDVLGEPRAGRKVVLTRRHRAVRIGRRGSSRRRPARPRGDVPRRRARPRPGDGSLHRG